MFAPWCPTCRSRMLLGARRVTSVESGPLGPRVVLRCFCDTLLVWSAEGEAQTSLETAPDPQVREAPAVREASARESIAG